MTPRRSGTGAGGGHGATLPAQPDAHRREIYANVFWVPQEARWYFLKDNAKKPEIGIMVDDAMVAIERENSRLRGDVSNHRILRFPIQVQVFERSATDERQVCTPLQSPIYCATSLQAQGYGMARVAYRPMKHTTALGYPQRASTPAPPTWRVMTREI